MATNFRGKIGEIGRLTFIRRLGIPHHSDDFTRFTYDYMATLCKHLVNVGPVTAEFERDKNAHHLLISIFQRSLGGATAGPCGDQY